MAKVRLLKKDINYLTFEFISECLTYKHFHPEIKDENVQTVIQGLLDKRNDAIRRMNNIEENHNPKLVKKYFKSLISDFEKSLDMMDSLSVK